MVLVENLMKEILESNKPEELYKYVLNEKNRVITKDYIKQTLGKYDINYQPNDIKLFEVAMTHPTYVNCDLTKPEYFSKIFTLNNSVISDSFSKIRYEDMAMPLKNVSYERLEFLGDSILKQIITFYIFLRYETMESGDLSKLRACLENRLSFSLITRKLNLNKYILISRTYEIVHARDNNNKMLCDVFESFIGALYLDISRISYNDIGKIPDIMLTDIRFSHQIIFNFIIKLLEDSITGPDLCQMIEIDTNYVSRLQSLFFNMNAGKPKYDESNFIDEKTNKKMFRAIVYDKNRVQIGIAIGPSSKNAKQACAKMAIEEISNVKQICG